jgi:hypothetical protein
MYPPPAGQPATYLLVASASLRLFDFADKHAAAFRPCRPSSFRFAALFRRGGCGLPLAAVWLAWRVVADGETFGSKKANTIAKQANPSFCLPAVRLPDSFSKKFKSIL